MGPFQSDNEIAEDDYHCLTGPSIADPNLMPIRLSNLKLDRGCPLPPLSLRPMADVEP